MSNRDYYEIIGVSPDASADEIKRAYRRLAREHHPDANASDPEAGERFKAINVAYETLKDPERRRRYDMFGPEGAAGQPGVDFGGFGSGFGDIFEAFFGSGSHFGRSASGGRYPSGTAPGDDIGVEVHLTFVEAVYGCDKEVDVRTMILCGECSGAGAEPGTHPDTCPNCQGRGEVSEVRRTVLGQIVTAHPCRNCRGAGVVIANPCDRCNGQGRVPESQKLVLKVPPGVDDAAQLRLTGRGDVGFRGGHTGDLYVRIRVSPAPPGWSRHGADLHYELHVPMTTATLGGRVALESLDATEVIDIDVMPATVTGARIRLRGKGGPRLRGTGRDDLYAEVYVDTPGEINAEQAELLRQLAALRGENVETPGVVSRLKNVLR